jgi:C1A family cysteine protease
MPVMPRFTVTIPGLYKTAARALWLILTFWSLALLVAQAQTARAAGPSAPASPGSGASFETLQVGAVTYHQVQVRSVNARTLVIAHSGGVASIRLRDLSPELQARFGYNPVAEAAADEALQRAAQQHQQERHAQAASQPAETDSKFENLLQRFGQKPEIKGEIDLRPRFFQLELGVKEQGRRPSCAVFAVVSALEYQNAEVTGQPEKLSEEYLIWATRKILNRASPSTAPAISEENPPADSRNATGDEDEGFSLSDVVTALRTYGIPPQSAMPDTIGRKMADIGEPSPDVISQARTHRRVYVHLVPGRDNAARIGNIIQALNAGVPVAIGLLWPNYRTLRAGFLSEQTPVQGAAHAVTLVGYKNPGERVEDTAFVFKNSYGPAWGEGGYGWVTCRYLQNYLLSAALLEVQRPDAAK